MNKYCDTTVLENNWFHWLLSSLTPDLEIYRKHKLLWTKVIGKVSDKHGVFCFPDPMYPIRFHCIALATPIYFNSNKGIIQHTKYQLPNDDELSLLSDSLLHNLDENLFAQHEEVIPSLNNNGYILEIPTETSWHAVLKDINNICMGVSVNFNQPSEEEQQELVNEALIQVTNKLATYKLVYIPGRAPVFNLLTTTIYRCMYSTMNRRKIKRQGLQKFVSDVQAGILPKYSGSRIKTH